MNAAWTRLALLPLCAALLACPTVNAPPCSDEAPCERGSCQGGFCLPECGSELDCALDEACREGTCGPRPQCSESSHCAVGFACEAEQCRCTTDSACALNEACIQGACRDRPACTTNEECAEFDLRCEPSQGLCVPPCTSASQCAPGVDPALAAALYACEAGTCRQRCVNDDSCGGELICLDGLCTAPECFARADCAADEYCTRA